ncbi:MAG TPA: annexin [Candidatus Limnocylindrales bacterium]|nr:annexin [Candidatus Limnocylindrales bacterium]
MRTHVDRGLVPRPDRAGARDQDRGRRAEPATGVGPVAFDSLSVADLQGRAGNRATVQAIRSGAAVQRAIDAGQAAGLAARVHDAMEGWGTDEDAVYGALTGRTPDEIDAIREAYLAAYDHTLLEDVRDDFSGGELARVERLLEGRAAPGAGATAAETEAAGVSLGREIAQQLVDAMRGLGTEEAQIFNALEGRTDAEMEEIRRQYFALTGHSLDRDLRDDLSGDELARALALVGSSESGSFENEFSEYLTEDYHASGRGLWEWEIANGQFLVHVGVRFEPNPGVTAPIPQWQSQVRSIWNRFALTGNGGTAKGGFEYPILFDLQDQSSASRRVRVLPNAKSGEYGNGDRAYADLWYPVMRDTIAPHEFGHLVGLADEYERTREDYQAVTGETIPGPDNASGRTPEQIAEDLHVGLSLDEQLLRAPSLTTTCEEVGLIAGGAPVQGTFAQSVMEAYNSAYEQADGESLLHAIRYRLTEGSFWTLISVFSYTSSSIMGNESNHTHPVAPRHLQPVLDTARAEHPDITWGLRLLR